MSAQALLERLDKVRRTAPDNWIACCPAHADKSPSLAVRALEDGRTLLHCFGGCRPDAVLGVLGMTVADLFPPRPRHPQGGATKSGIRPMDALRCIAGEATVVMVAADMLRGGEVLAECDVARLATAAKRIRTALEVAHA